MSGKQISPGAKNDRNTGGKNMPLLDVKNVKKIYTTRFGGAQVQALADVTFSVERGEYVAIMGESGSGARVIIRPS